MKALKRSLETIKHTTVSRVIIFIIMALYSVSMIAAIIWAIFASLKTQNELLLYNPNGFPQTWQFQNYVEAFKSLGQPTTNLLGMFGSSLWYSIGASLLGCMACAVTAYVFSKYNFPGKKVLFVIFMVAMMLPIYGSFAARYKLTADLGLQNSLLFIIVGAAGYGNVMLIFLASFDSLSWQYAESAEIDGANDFYIFFKIMFPLIKPAFIAIMLTSMINCWNDYMTPLIYLKDMPTVAAGLYIFKQNMMFGELPVYYAGVVMSFIPTIILFSIFRKTIMENVAVGGLKG